MEKDIALKAKIVPTLYIGEDQALMNLMRLIVGESERFPLLSQRFAREIEKPIIENFDRYLAAQTQLQLSDPMVAARIFVDYRPRYKRIGIGKALITFFH